VHLSGGTAYVLYGQDGVSGYVPYRRSTGDPGNTVSMNTSINEPISFAWRKSLSPLEYSLQLRSGINYATAPMEIENLNTGLELRFPAATTSSNSSAAPGWYSDLIVFPYALHRDDINEILSYQENVLNIRPLTISSPIKPSSTVAEYTVRSEYTPNATTLLADTANVAEYTVRSEYTPNATTLLADTANVSEYDPIEGTVHVSTAYKCNVMYHGNKKITGTVRSVSNDRLKAKVRLYDDHMHLVDETWSDSYTGEFEFNSITSNGSYTVIVYDPQNEFNAVVTSKVKAV
jgi:hypothetical protein